MKNVYISELYQGLLLGLNGLIDKTIEIQKSQGNNTHEYREALSFQLELEKTKLSIMQSLSDSFDTKIKSKELVGYDNDGREVFKIKENGDARFVGEISTQDLKKSNEGKKENIHYGDKGVLEYEVHLKAEVESNYNKVKQLLDYSIEDGVLVAVKEDSFRRYGKSKSLDEKSKELGVKVIRRRNFNNNDNTVVISEIRAGRFKLNTQFLVDECVTSDDIKFIEKQGYVIIGGFYRIK